MQGNHQYLSIILKIKARNDKDGCFNLPANLCYLFNFKPRDEIHLILENNLGKKYNGKIKLKTNYEICGDDIKNFVKAGEIIKVTIFNK
jgi:hypothetical protein